MKTLRPHQVKALDGLRDGFRRGHRRGLLVMPTGAGKTVAAVAMLRGIAERGRRGLFVADRRVLVNQAAKVFREEGLDVGIVMADAPWGFHRPDAPIQVVSKDSLVSWLERPDFRLPPADTVVNDECHRTSGASWRVLRGQYPDAFEVGLTATPAVGDRGMGDLYEFMTQPVTYAELQRMGVLVKPHCFAPGSRVTGKAGKKPSRAALVGDAVYWWKAHAEGLRTFVFACDVAHSIALRDEYRKAGVAAEHIDASTPDDERTAVLDRLRRREVTVVTNVDILRYGVDVVEAECCQLMAPMASLVAYRQSAGRVLRADPANPDKRAVVLDHAGAALYHGLPDADIEWPLDAGTDATAANRKRMSEGGEAAQPVACPQCHTLFAGRADCPACGWKPQRKGKAKGTAAGTLVRVDGGGGAAGPTPADLTRVWRQKLGIAANKGMKVTVAGVMFRKATGRWPESCGVTPLPPTKADWSKPTGLVFPEYVGHNRG